MTSGRRSVGCESGNTGGVRMTKPLRRENERSETDATREVDGLTSHSTDETIEVDGLTDSLV